MSEELQKIVDEYREKEIHISDEEAEQILWLCNRKMDISKIEDREAYLPLYEAVKNYAAQCKKQRTETMYIKHGKTFLGESTPFLDYLPKDKPVQSEAEYDDNENPFGRSE